MLDVVIYHRKIKINSSEAVWWTEVLNYLRILSFSSQTISERGSLGLCLYDWGVVCELWWGTDMSNRLFFAKLLDYITFTCWRLILRIRHLDIVAYKTKNWLIYILHSFSFLMSSDILSINVEYRVDVHILNESKCLFLLICAEVTFRMPCETRNRV